MSATSGQAPAEPAGLARRIASMVYEALLVTALVLFAALLFPGAATSSLGGPARHALFVYLALVVAIYFVWLWTRGQTLAMRAWRLRIVGANDRPPTWQRALLRYLLALALIGPMLAAALWLREHSRSPIAWALLVPGLLALAWPLWDRQRRTLYDRLAGTRLIRLR